MVAAKSMAMKSLLPAIAGLIIKGMNTLLEIGVKGVCCADALNPARMNKASNMNVLLNIILVFHFNRVNGELIVKFHDVIRKNEF